MSTNLRPVILDLFRLGGSQLSEKISFGYQGRGEEEGEEEDKEEEE